MYTLTFLGGPMQTSNTSLTLSIEFLVTLRTKTRSQALKVTVPNVEVGHEPTGRRW